MSEPFIGEIRTVAFDFAPRHFALCDGQLLPIHSNQALYAVLGTAYGGDGRTTLGLPDLRGRLPVHRSQRLPTGHKGGQEQVTLSTAQLPGHSHALKADSDQSTARSPADSPADRYPAAADNGQNLYSAPATTSVKMQPTGNAGSGQAHDNMQPSLAINFVIALAGLFPSRN